MIAVANVAGQEQINFQVPAELAGASSASLVITANGQSSAPLLVPLLSAQPELFPLAEATRGSTTSFYGTGFGPVANLGSSVAVRIGGVSAPVSFAGLAPNFVGLYQLNVTVPESVTAGVADVIVSVGTAESRPVKLMIR
ncbi:MAG: hypothetical protein WKF37_25470 [Bryobacteraceae bacterium]